MNNEVMVRDNMKIWDQVSQTDPSATKQVSQRGGYTSICATYQAQRATELFGSYGKGWGLKSINYDYSMFESMKMVFCHAVFFYTEDGKQIEFPLSNAINPMMGAKPDEDFFKKVETNTISKALSRLGFSADVFLGKFDDADYVNQIIAEERIEKAENRDAEIEKTKQELVDYVVRNTSTINAAVSANEARGVHKSVVRHLELKKTVSFLSEICARGSISVTKALNDKLTSLENKQ